MPLKHGKGNKVFHSNVREMILAGHPLNQALAASYKEQREAEGKEKKTDKKKKK